MDDKTQRYAVLTGDIVGSSKLSPADLQKLMQRLREGADRFLAAFPNAVFGKLDVFSGDGWQMLMPDWKRSLRAAVYMRAVAKSTETLRTDTRIAVAWGMVDTESLKPERISVSTGEAFMLSGHALKAMGKQERLTMDCGGVSRKWDLLRACLGVVDGLMGLWTARQAETVAVALLGRGQEEIAKQLGKRQPTIYRALQTAGWRGIEGLVNEVENSP